MKKAGPSRGKARPDCQPERLSRTRVQVAAGAAGAAGASVGTPTPSEITLPPAQPPPAQPPPTQPPSTQPAPAPQPGSQPPPMQPAPAPQPGSQPPPTQPAPAQPRTRRQRTARVRQHDRRATPQLGSQQPEPTAAQDGPASQQVAAQVGSQQPRARRQHRPAAEADSAATRPTTTSAKNIATIVGKRFIRTSRKRTDAPCVPAAVTNWTPIRDGYRTAAHRSSNPPATAAGIPATLARGTM
jgi:type IV secretory pathway VirB10-like protein